MSKECMRKFGVEKINITDDYDKFICKDCGAHYGMHVRLDCPTAKEIAERSPVERGGMPADAKKGDDRHKFERLKIISRATTTLIFAMFSLWIVFKLITFLFARCP